MTNQQSQARPPDPPPLFGRPGGPHAMLGRKAEQARDRRGTVLRLWRYVRRQRVPLATSAAMVVASSGLAVVGPYLLGRAIDGAIATGDLAGLARICGLMLAVYGLSSLLTWLTSYVMAGAAQQTVRDIRGDLFGRLQALPLRFFDRQPHGDLMSRLTNDVENVSQVLADGVVQIVSGVLSMVGIAAVMLAINAPLGLTCIAVTAGATLLMNQVLAPRLRGGFRQQQAALGALNGLIEETIGGLRVVKAYGREASVLGSFEVANLELRGAAIRAQTLGGLIGPLMNVIGHLSLAVLAGVGGWMALAGSVTVGTIASFISYQRQFARPLSELATLYSSLQSAIAGAERVFAVIDEPPEAEAPAAPLAQLRGEVAFRDVSFAYVPGVPVLRHLSLEARPGQLIALVGPTGAGKTTVVNLLTRFYEVDSGAILIDGQDIRQLARASLRQQLGIVLQDTYLFAGTVMENIRYGRLDATDDEVIAAATLANADPFIRRLPHGYATPLAERAGNVSQGQRQLLAIARAVLADPRILILDEATSSVDTRTEQHIQEAMRRLMRGRTSFVIAHRLSTIRDADQILVIDGGVVVECGSHAELLAQAGFYARLYAGQLRGQPGLAAA